MNLKKEEFYKIYIPLILLVKNKKIKNYCLKILTKIIIMQIF